MNTTQLLLLILNSLNENRELSHTEQSRIYAFFKVEIEANNISINEFMFNLNDSSIVYLIDSHKRPFLIERLEHALYLASEKAFNLKNINNGQ